LQAEEESIYGHWVHARKQRILLKNSNSRRPQKKLAILRDPKRKDSEGLHRYEIVEHDASGHALQASIAEGLAASAVGEKISLLSVTTFSTESAGCCCCPSVRFQVPV